MPEPQRIGVERAGLHRVSSTTQHTGNAGADDPAPIARGLHARVTEDLAVAILGLDVQRSPLSAWRQLCGEEETDAHVVSNESRRRRLRNTLRGGLVEMAAMVLTRRRFSIAAIDGGSRIDHPSLSWAAADVDAVVTSRPALASEAPRVVRPDDLVVPANARHGLAVHTVHVCAVDEARAWQWTPHEVSPPAAVAVAWQLAHMPEADTALVAALLGGALDLRVYVCARDTAITAAAFDFVGRWYERHVLTRQPPTSETIRHDRTDPARVAIWHALVKRIG